jgi:DNA-damage-inducible protein J
MTKTAIVRAQVEAELKKQAEARFSEWGMTVDEAITLFYERVTSICSDPFSPHIPNAETIEAMNEGRDGEGLTEYASLDDLKAKFS